VHGTLDHGQTYLILTNRAIEPAGFDLDSGWPCYVPSSTSNRVEAN
jgi:hypothetical protein